MSTPIYIYTEEDLREFYFNHKGCEICKIIIEYFDLEFLLDTTFNLIDVVNFLSNCDDIMFIQDICFWINMYFICNFDKWLFEYKIENTQWIFNTPTHPFEIYLSKNIRKS